MKRVLGVAAIVAVVAWWVHEPSRTTAARDVRVPDPVAAPKRAAPMIAAPRPPPVAHHDSPPNVLSGQLDPATTALLDAAVERTLARCGAMASGDTDLEADLTLVDGAATEADVLADPHAEYPPALVDCVRDTLASSDLAQDDDTAVVRLPLPFRP
jgi:hypothetical protein